VASGKACRSSVVTSLLTKKLVVPVTSLGPASGFPSRAVSVNFTLSARLNSVVASTFSRTERAGFRIIRDISPVKVASALSSLVISKVPSCWNCLIKVSVTKTSMRGTSVRFLNVGTAML